MEERTCGGGLEGRVQMYAQHPKLDAQLELLEGKKGGKTVTLLKMAMQAVTWALLAVEKSGNFEQLRTPLADSAEKESTGFLEYSARTVLVSIGLACR